MAQQTTRDAAAASTSSFDEEEIRSQVFGKHRHSYSTRDVILYNLGLGCTVSKHLSFLYEGIRGGLRTLPTYAIVSAHPAIFPVVKFLSKFIPGMTLSRALHGEQYVEIVGPIPTSGTLLTRCEVVSVEDKGPGKGAVLVARTVTSDEATGRDVAVNEFTSFVLGVGGFGGKYSGSPRAPAATAANNPPQRTPDAVAHAPVSADQAALYRLSGDYNPLHIDPAVSSAVGYKTPILHGLCTLGMSVRLVLEQLQGAEHDAPQVKSIKARFSSHVFPGEQLAVEMWQATPRKVIFRTKVVDRGAVAISNAAVDFAQDVTLVRGQADAARGVSTQSRL